MHKAIKIVTQHIQISLVAGIFIPYLHSCVKDLVPNYFSNIIGILDHI